MKVLNVNISIDSRTGGGTAERTYQMTRFLARHGVNCTVLTLDLGLQKQLIDSLSGVKVIAMPCLVRRFYIPKVSLKVIKDAVNDADIIHLMSHWTLLNAMVYFYIKRLRKPYVVCPAGALPIYGRSSYFKKFYNWIIGKEIILNANGHIAVAINELEQFEAYGVARNRVHHIANGVCEDDFVIKDKTFSILEFSLPEVKYILFVGRLNSIKGPDLLLQAFAHLNEELADYHLVYVGPDDGMLLDLQNSISKEIKDRVHFLGYLSGQEKAKIYQLASLVVIPSRHEAMSIVVLEAGISAKPVLITDQCGFSEIASIGCGLVVPASVDGLQKGLVKLLQNLSQLMQMGLQLKTYVKQHYSWDSMVMKMMQLYQQILPPKD